MINLSGCFLLARLVSRGRSAQFLNALAQQVFQHINLRHGMNIAPKPEVRHSVVGQDRNIQSQLTADRHVGIAPLELVTQQIQR